MAITAGARAENAALKVRHSWWWAALLDLAQNAMGADGKRRLFAMLAVRQMSQDLG